MTMEIEYLSNEQAAWVMRAQIQRMETEIENLRKKLAALLIVNGPQELPADLHPDFTKVWEVKTKRVRRKVILSAVKLHAKAVA